MLLQQDCIQKTSMTHVGTIQQRLANKNTSTIYHFVMDLITIYQNALWSCDFYIYITLRNRKLPDHNFPKPLQSKLAEFEITPP